MSDEKKSDEGLTPPPKPTVRGLGSESPSPPGDKGSRRGADSTRRIATTGRQLNPEATTAKRGGSRPQRNMSESKETLIPGPRTRVPVDSSNAPKRTTTGPRGGTLMANLGATDVPKPIQLKPSPDQEEISRGLRRIEGRYNLGQELGRGGMGVVRLVKDLDVGRDVAMKTLIPEDPDADQLRNALIKEAQITGQLQHPNIIPVYELGVLPNNEVFYTMRAIKQLTLKDVLRNLRRGDDDSVEKYNLRRLLNIFSQVCQAMHYAHSKGVVHRDLKPDNIMLGEYGEVLVLDWGIAYVIERDKGSPLASPGVVVGTPHYMAPEQASGQIDLVDGRSDVFSLGVILFEILTLQTPIMDSDTDIVLDKLRRHTQGFRPQDAETPREVPEPLAELVTIATELNPKKRFPTARVLYDKVEAYLAGSEEQERRVKMAGEELGTGVHALSQYYELKRSRQRLAERITKREAEVHRWDSTAVKRELWELTARYNHMELVVSQAFSEAVNHFHRVLGLVPNQSHARAALTNLYWTRFEQAENAGDYANMIYFGNLVLRYNDPKRGPLHEGVGWVTVRSIPEGAELVLFDFTKGVPDTQLASGRKLGAAPVSEVELPMGNFLLVAHKDGYRDSHLPVFVRPGESKSYLLTLHPWASEETLVGRDGELSTLRFNLEAAVSSKSVRRVLVTGQDGIGKNRLFNAFNDYIQGLTKSPMLFFAECHEQHALVPYGALTEAFRIRAGVVSEDDAVAVRAKLFTMIEKALASGGPPSQSDREKLNYIVDILVKLPGLAPGELAPDLPPAEMRVRFDEAIMESIKMLARWTPVVWVLYEVEYLDDASATLIRRSSRFLDSTPMLILGFGVDVGMQRGWDERIRLGPLSESAVEALLRALLKGPLPAGLSKYVMARSAGVPWMVVDTVRELAESFDLYTEGDGWVLKDTLEAPERCSMLTARANELKGLPPHLCQTLQAAAVIGDIFWIEALEAMGVEDPQRCCDELTDREFIRTVPSSRYRDAKAYAFRSLLFREIVYDQIVDHDRLTAMHATVADWIRARFLGDIREVAELAKHVELSHDDTWAALLFGQLGDVCRDIGCMGLARECYQRALTNTVEQEDRVLLEERLKSVRGG